MRKTKGHQMKQVQYVTRDGRPLKEDDALDRHGIIRNGVVMRTSMTMLDHDNERLADSARRAALVTDGAGSSSFHRPGFRMQLGDKAGNAAKEASLATYNRML